jgi:hypothetical protein
MKRVVVWNPLVREKLIEYRDENKGVSPKWIQWEKPSPRGRNVSVKILRRFDARGMARVYSRGDDYSSRRRFDMDVWLCRDGRLLARFSSHSKKVKNLSLELRGFKPDHSLFGVVADSNPLWLPKSLRDIYEEWTLKQMYWFSLSDSRKELLEIQQEICRLQKRIEVVQDYVAKTLVRLFGEERPAFAGLAEQELIEKIAGPVTARLGATPKAQSHGDKRYVRDVEAATFLGVRVGTLRRWRSKRPPCGPPVTRMGKMVMYSVRELERFMEERTLRRVGKEKAQARFEDNPIEGFHEK